MKNRYKPIEIPEGFVMLPLHELDDSALDGIHSRLSQVASRRKGEPSIDPMFLATIICLGDEIARRRAAKASYLQHTGPDVYDAINELFNRALTKGKLFKDDIS